MLPKSSPAPAKSSPPPTNENGDPMLQGAYVQEDAKDFESPADEIAAFEQRLQHGGSAPSATPHNHPRHTFVPSAQHPLNSKPTAAPPSTASAASATPHFNGQRRMSEAEQEEAIQLQEDVGDVRQLDARFGGAGDDSD